MMPQLRQGRVHELCGSSALAFAFLAAKEGQTTFCGPPSYLSSLHPQCVAQFHDPNSILFVLCPLVTDVLWAAENALRSSNMTTVIVFTDRSPNLTNFRRLQLAALAGNSLGIVIVNKPAPNTAAETRWRCVPIYSDDEKAIRIHASLYKNKRGIIGSWKVNVFGEKNALYMDAAPSGEPVSPYRVAS